MDSGSKSDVLIIGAGIGGLTLALTLHRAGIPARLYESSPAIQPLGVGINILPHASEELCDLGLEDELASAAVVTREAVFFNRFGQLIYTEPLGRYAGYASPQFSIHRGDLQRMLLDAVVQRLGRDRIVTGVQCIGFEQDGEGARAVAGRRERRELGAAAGLGADRLRWSALAHP